MICLAGSCFFTWGGRGEKTVICWAGPCFFTWGGGRGEDSDLFGWAVFLYLGRRGVCCTLLLLKPL